MTLGDRGDPIAYGGGVVYRDQYGLHVERWSGAEDSDSDDDSNDAKIVQSVYQFDVPPDVLKDHSWVKPSDVAETHGMDVDELRRMSKSRKIAERVEVLEMIGGHYGYDNLDHGPISLTGAEIMRRWGNTFTRRGRPTGRKTQPKRKALANTRAKTRPAKRKSARNSAQTAYRTGKSGTDHFDRFYRYDELDERGKRDWDMLEDHNEKFVRLYDGEFAPLENFEKLKSGMSSTGAKADGGWATSAFDGYFIRRLKGEQKRAAGAGYDYIVWREHW